jgi:glutaredoxin
MDRAYLKQECPLAFVVLAWLIYAGGIGFFIFERQFVPAGVFVVLAPALMWAYIRWFPSISRFMGYGRVDDKAAGPIPSNGAADVTLYTALGCPFCPIVRRRLVALQAQLRFQLHVVDVTARPDILTRKGIWSVPVVEVGGRTWVGHATSEQLVGLLAKQKAA